MLNYIAPVKWLILALLIVVLSAAEAVAYLPWHSTEIAKNGSAIQFDFKLCGTSPVAHNVRLWRIEVIDKKQPLVVLCKRSSKAGIPRQLSRWIYGAPLEGFDGLPCPPLAVGSYVIATAGDLGSASNGSIGDREFRVGADGALSVEKDKCTSKK